MSTLKTVELPEFGREAVCPALEGAVYRARLEALQERMARAELDVLVVYGDREHSANLAYLTGFDPRFEEALLLLDRCGNRLLVVGNECMGYLPDVDLGIRAELFQEFSLMGQPRGASRPLEAILRDFGIGSRTRVGCVGWKYYDGRLLPARPPALDAPAYLADLLRALVQSPDGVANATRLLMDPHDGLRNRNEPEQIAQFEYASTWTSGSVLRALRALREGVEEQELEAQFHGGGLPRSCHAMVSFGEKAQRGLASPSNRRAARGDAYTMAYGVWGALTCRAGVVARGPEDLGEALRGFYPPYVANYFDVVAAWYGALRLGVTGGQVFAAVERVRDARRLAFAVNPGHTLHLDEWVHSPFEPGSSVPLHSGMALQMDIIPISQGPFCYANAEDGVVLADAALRGDLARRWPGLWGRVQARREFMARSLGIRLDESVLPLSNIPAWLPPYALDLTRAMVA